MGEEEKEKLDADLDLLIDLSKIVWPTVTMSKHPTKLGYIKHDLKYLQGHNQYISSQSTKFYTTRYQILLYEFMSKSLPSKLYQHLVKLKQADQPREAIQYLANKLLT